MLFPKRAMFDDELGVWLAESSIWCGLFRLLEYGQSFPKTPTVPAEKSFVAAMIRNNHTVGRISFARLRLPLRLRLRLRLCVTRLLAAQEDHPVSIFLSLS
jgi:hypothetical protein